MSNYSKEQVLQWVNSSEARAAKYEQEAKDLMKKIQSLEEKLETCRQDLQEKVQMEGEVEAQEEVMQIAIVKRRERMLLLQDRADQKLERVEKLEIQKSILDGSFLNESFQESLKPSSLVSDVRSIAERSRYSFDDILGLTSVKKSGGKTREHQTPAGPPAKNERFLKDYKEFKHFQLNLNSKRQELEMGFKEKKARMRMTVGAFTREKDKIEQIYKKLT